MRLAELEAELPNGLRNALLAELHYDLIEATLTLDLELGVGDPQALTAQARELTRPARLTFRRVTSFTLECPARPRPLERAQQPELVSGELDPSVSDGLEAITFLRHETNSRLRFVTGGMDLEWVEEERGYR